MKSFSIFSVPTLALTAVFLLGTGSTQAQDDAKARTDAAEGLLTAMHTEQMVEGTTTRMLTVVDRFNQSVIKQGNLTTEQSDAIQKAEDEARDTIRKELGYPTLKSEFIQAYADTFSEQELKDLAAFYNSPVGQKLVEKQPALNEKVGKSAQQKTQTVLRGVVQKLQAVAQKNLPPAPTPATVVPAPGTPTTPTSVVTPGVPAVPATPGVPPVAAIPTAVTAPVPAVPTPLPSPTPATTPAAQ